MELTTIDAKALARDYVASHLTNAILTAADTASKNTEEELQSSLEERYLILNELLKENKYETVKTKCTLTLVDTGTDQKEWEIRRTHDLENSLVGGLITYLSDSDLLTPEET